MTGVAARQHNSCGLLRSPLSMLALVSYEVSHLFF